MCTNILNHNVLHLVLEYLEFEQVVDCTYVCKDWYTIIKSEEERITKRFLSRDFHCTKDVTLKLDFRRLNAYYLVELFATQTPKCHCRIEWNCDSWLAKLQDISVMIEGVSAWFSVDRRICYCTVLYPVLKKCMGIPLSSVIFIIDDNGDTQLQDYIIAILQHKFVTTETDPVGINIIRLANDSVITIVNMAIAEEIFSGNVKYNHIQAESYIVIDRTHGFETTGINRKVGLMNMAMRHVVYKNAKLLALSERIEAKYINESQLAFMQASVCNELKIIQTTDFCFTNIRIVREFTNDIICGLIPSFYKTMDTDYQDEMTE